MCLTEGKLGKVLRLARALRPLRLMKRNERMRAVIDALIGTLRPVIYVILFLSLTIVIFAIVGLGLFGGKFQSCSTQDLLFYTVDASVSYPFGRTECVGSFVRDNGTRTLIACMHAMSMRVGRPLVGQSSVCYVPESIRNLCMQYNIALKRLIDFE